VLHHLVSPIAHGLDGLLQALGRDAELLGPVAHFVLLTDVDALPVLTAADVGIVRHALLRQLLHRVRSNGHSRRAVPGAAMRVYSTRLPSPGAAT
jgi:folate-dependent phosphoribosylglycinamide formyltransferase PurN